MLSAPGASLDLFDRKAVSDEIILRLGIMEGVLKWHTSRGHNDNAKVAEDVVARFLSALCGWSLVNLNTIRPNYPAADLGDIQRRLAIQVTVNGTSGKVRETHEKAIAHQLSADFDTLIILFLLEKAPGDPRKSKTFTPCTKPKIDKWARPEISARLVKQSTESDAACRGRLCRSLAVLREEMSGITHIIWPTCDVPPHYLPWASIRHHFKGRTAFLDTLHATLLTKNTSAISGHSIRGDAGIGKTCAAVEYAWQQFFLHTGVFFVTADSPASLQSNLAALGASAILDLPGHDTQTMEKQHAAVVAWLKAHPGWLIMLDNADQRPAFAAVMDLLPAIPGGHIIITTRQDIAVREITALRMECLTPADSIAYLRDATHGYRRLEPDDDDAETTLATELGGLPLGLSQAAAHICHLGCSYRDYLQLRAKNAPKAQAWHDPLTMHYPWSLAVTYETSVSQLSPGAHALLLTLAWFAPDPIPVSILSAEAAPGEASDHFGELKSLSLVQHSEDGRAFTLHRLVQEITRQQQAHPTMARASSLGAPPATGTTLPSRGGPQESCGLEARATHEPPALTTALTWVDAAIPDVVSDVRPVASPVARLLWVLQPMMRRLQRSSPATR